MSKATARLQQELDSLRFRVEYLEAWHRWGAEVERRQKAGDSTLPRIPGPPRDPEFERELRRPAYRPGGRES